MFVKLTKDQHQLMISNIQEFFSEERDENISDFAAERVLDFIKESIAPHFYNAAISDAIFVAQQQFSSLEVEMSSLERPIKK
ncbi:hypothetical protein AM500_04450 [Bacillus sp. FJAT-18017]|uniref:DUF2164 domain-containing protein n=1 Tax=Bacillus sp. FJAT-18017 TaxID=1705566 RepID=UPI0006AF178A|nr:DUF2164 domain-containing protein [Bacillus sp. FJAT-18017]ALC89123.1 hypothetical protein AM500_04450 [Bacillus sp. FJAT-18017]